MIVENGKLITPAPAPATAATTGIDPMAVMGVTSNLLSFQSQATEMEAAAEGSLLTAAGADEEAAAYGTATGISEESQRTEAIAESVRQIQQTRAIDQTIGGISAGVAANGFQQSGSALDIMQSSYQQGYLSQQISGLQSQQVQRGYMEQSAAAKGEMAAAGVRGDAARLLSEAQMSSSNSAKANQAALTNALTQLLSGDPNAQQLVNDLMTGNIAGAQADALLYNPAGADQPLATSTTPDENAKQTATSASFGTVWAQPDIHGLLMDGTSGLVQQTGDSNINVKFVA